MDLEKRLAAFPLPLQQAMIREGQFLEVPEGTELLREGQYVKVVPLVLSGTIKVCSRFEDRDLLLYYIRPDESCIMSLSAVLENSPSKIFAVAEERTGVLLLPSRLLSQWIETYPVLNRLFYRQFHQRYEDLLASIQDLLFNKMDQRILDYLRGKSHLRNTRRLPLRHREIAADLGTAREVVSRVLKKLETEGKVRQWPQGIIEIL